MPKTTVRYPPRANGWALANCPPSSEWGPGGNTKEIKAARKGTGLPTSQSRWPRTSVFSSRHFPNVWIVYGIYVYLWGFPLIHAVIYTSAHIFTVISLFTVQNLKTVFIFPQFLPRLRALRLLRHFLTLTTLPAVMNLKVLAILTTCYDTCDSNHHCWLRLLPCLRPFSLVGILLGMKDTLWYYRNYRLTAQWSGWQTGKLEQYYTQL